MIESLRYNIHFSAEHIYGHLNTFLIFHLVYRFSSTRTSTPNGQETYGGPTRSPSSLMTTADFLISKSLSEESRSSNKNIFLTYKQFLQDHEAAYPLVLKLSHIVSYIAHCFTIGLAASTTRTHIVVLSFIFQLVGHQDLTQHFII